MPEMQVTTVSSLVPGQDRVQQRTSVSRSTHAISRDLVIIERSTALKNLDHGETVLIDALRRAVANLTPQANNILQILP